MAMEILAIAAAWQGNQLVFPNGYAGFL